MTRPALKTHTPNIRGLCPQGRGEPLAIQDHATPTSATANKATFEAVTLK